VGSIAVLQLLNIGYIDPEFGNMRFASGVQGQRELWRSGSGA